MKERQNWEETWQSFRHVWIAELLNLEGIVHASGLLEAQVENVKQELLHPFFCG